MREEKILIADDEESIREILAEILENSGYKVNCAIDGIDAVEKLKMIEKISGIGQYREELRKINDFISSYEFDETEKVVFKWIESI